jgi:hypothetical protein
LRELGRVARPSADVLVGLTVKSQGVDNQKGYAPAEALKAGAERIPTFIWNKRRFLEALEQEGLEIRRIGTDCGARSLCETVRHGSGKEVGRGRGALTGKTRSWPLLCGRRRQPGWILRPVS